MKSLRRDVGPFIDEEESVAEISEQDEVELHLLPFVPKSKTDGKKRKQAGQSKFRRSRASKKVGDAGEKIVFGYEQKRLIELGLEDLSSHVRWLADEGEHPGYDILSYNEDGSERWIEVKTSKGSAISVIEITENERKTAEAAPEGRYWIYLVTKVFTRPQLTPIQDPVRNLSWDEENPSPVSWKLELLERSPD